MKKNVITVFVIFMCISLLAGCGKSAGTSSNSEGKSNSNSQAAASNNSSSNNSSNSTGNSKSDNTSNAAKPLKITMAGGSAGGASQAIGEAVGEAIKKTASGTSFTYQPSKFGANAPLVGEGKADIGMELGEFVYWAAKGEEVYKRAYPNLNVIAFLHEDLWSLQVQKDTGITSIDQIVQKKFPLKISVNTKNGGLEYPNRWVFKEYGFSYDDLEKWGGTVNFSSSGEAGNLFKDRKLNALAWTAQQPISLYYDYYKAVPVNWLEPSPQAVEKVIKSHKSLKPGVIPAKLYENVGLTKDYHTFSMPMVLVAGKELPEETAYTIAKSIYNNMDYLHKANDVFRDLNKNSIVPKIEGVAVHPGAAKFYREMGLIK